MKRREFLVATSVIGGGMALAILPHTSRAAPSAGTPSELTPWLTISPDDIVTVRAPGPEAGTGNTTQTAIYVAEELACDWTKVRVEPISFNRNVREKDLYPVSYTHLRAHETPEHLVCRLLLEKKK